MKDYMERIRKSKMMKARSNGILVKPTKEELKKENSMDSEL
jgi:hypothetical protein